MKKTKKPEIIDIPPAKLEGIKSRLSTNELLHDDEKKIVLTIISTYSWLMSQLQSTKLTIHRLKKLFSFSTEKHKHLRQHMKPPMGSNDGLEAPEDLSLNEQQGISEGPSEKK